MFKTFTRTWWKKNPSWPGGREPGVGRRFYRGCYQSEEEARRVCREYNATHDPGPLSNKMEYEEE